MFNSEKQKQFIRPMRVMDIESVRVIEKQCYEFPWSEGIFYDCLRVGYPCFVYEVLETVQAYSIMSVAAGECHLLNLCVSPVFQNQGLGQMMMSHMMQAAQALEAKEMFLEVRESNQAAIHLYQSIGFDQIGIRKDYYPAAQGRENALVFSCKLDWDEPVV